MRGNGGAVSGDGEFMRHCYAGAAEGWGCDEWGEGGGGGCLVDGVGVWEVVIFEGCLVEDGRFAE